MTKNIDQHQTEKMDGRGAKVAFKIKENG